MTLLRLTCSVSRTVSRPAPISYMPYIWIFTYRIRLFLCWFPPSTQNRGRVNSARPSLVLMFSRAISRASATRALSCSSYLQSARVACIPQTRRALHVSAAVRADTLANIVGDESEFTTTHVRSIKAAGIELSDGLLLRGPCILHGGRVFLWDPPLPSAGANPWDAWTAAHFAPFEVVVPKPELLIVGTGVEAFQPPPRMRHELAKMGLTLDVMDTVSESVDDSPCFADLNCCSETRAQRSICCWKREGEWLRCSFRRLQRPGGIECHTDFVYYDQIREGIAEKTKL